MTFEVYTSEANQEHRWRLRHSNGNVMAESGEGYKRLDDCLNAVQRIRDEAKEAELVHLNLPHGSLKMVMPPTESM